MVADIWSGGAVEAIWVYMVDGWEDRYLGRSFYIWVGGEGKRKRSRGWLDLVMGCSWGFRIDGFVLFWMDWFVQLHQ